jgi:hypothetical protein
MIEVKLYKNTLKGLKVLALTIPFVIVGIWMITKADSNLMNSIMGWFAIIFFGLGIPVGLFHLFDRRPQIIITENSIWDKSTNQDEIKWEQIHRAYPLNIFGQKFISLDVDNTFVFKKMQYNWVEKINEEIGAQKLNLHINQLKIDQNRLIAFIEEMTATERGNRLAIIEKYFDLDQLT